MVDYMQKAREAALATGKFQLNGAPCFEVALATTLEALDKAEAERDALTQVARKAVDLISRDASANCGHGPKKGLSVEASLALRELRALIQPEPDPLDRMMRDFYLSPEYDPKAERHADVVKAAMGYALARHGLAVKEVG